MNMISENVSNLFPPFTYSTAYNFREEIQQYIDKKGVLLSNADGIILYQKQPVDSVFKSASYTNDNAKKTCRNDDHFLLKFLAQNTLELAASTSDVFSKQHLQVQPQRPYRVYNSPDLNALDVFAKNTKPSQLWFQLSGHPNGFAPAGPGTIWKKCGCRTEAVVYKALSQESALRDIIPRFLREVEYGGGTFIELQDLLHNFNDPHVMDIKMGTRTFLESEVQNTFAREDLYLKMLAVDPKAPTAEEKEAKKVTKLRYMQFREEQSSTSTLGFRIEAVKFRGLKPVTDLKKVKNVKDVLETLFLFLGKHEDIRQRLLLRLIEIRTKLEQSQYFKIHEVVGSSILIIYDDVKVGAWLIDFAKTKPVPQDIFLTHRLPWFPGNHEDGFLYGLDQLVKILKIVKTIPLLRRV